MELSIPSIRQLAEGKNPDSFSNRFRSRRFQRFEALVATLPRPLRILDVGGTNQFWENRGWADRTDVQIFSLNLEAEEQQHENIIPLAGDATNLAQFADGSFEVAFSNSVIEHLFSFEQQRRMASEIQRVSKSYWVQTPNFWFPMEPHFHVPGWQWMPLSLRIAMIRRWRCGWRARAGSEHGPRIADDISACDATARAFRWTGEILGRNWWFPGGSSGSRFEK